jgi:hypothetical protein
MARPKSALRANLSPPTVFAAVVPLVAGVATLILVVRSGGFGFVRTISHLG